MNVLGINKENGEIFSADADVSRRHMYITGYDKVGRENFIKNQIEEDIKNDNPFILLDIDNNIEKYISNKYKEHNNILIFDGENYKCNVFKELKDRWEAENMSYILHDTLVKVNRLEDKPPEFFQQFLKMSLITLFEIRNLYPMSFDSLMMIIEDHHFMGVCLEKLKTFKYDKDKHDIFYEKMENVIKYWEQFEQNMSYDSEFKTKSIPQIKEWLMPIYKNEYIKNMFVSKEANITFDELINTNKKVIVKLNASKIGEKNAEILGLIFLQHFILEGHYKGYSQYIDSRMHHKKYLNVYINNLEKFGTSYLSYVIAEGIRLKTRLILCAEDIKSKEVGDRCYYTSVGNISNIVLFKNGHNGILGNYIHKDNIPVLMNELGNLKENEFYFLVCFGVLSPYMKKLSNVT